MSSTGYFENPKIKSSESDASSDILNVSKDALSNQFQQKVINFKNTNILFLVNNMKKDIFYDGTVYTGSTGLALFYLMNSLKKNRICMDTLQRSLTYVDVNNLKARRISFLCGDAGTLAIAAVISYRLGNQRPPDLPEYEHLTKRLINLQTLLNDSPDEILYGKAGYLYALLFVNKYTDKNYVIPADVIEKVISAILKSGKDLAFRMKCDCPLMWQWHEKTYLGAAHGVAGILYILLQARVYIKSSDLENYIKPTLDWLMNLQFPSGNFPSSLESKSRDRLVQWCHGAPGFVPLCLLAYQVFNKEKYLKIAEKCGEVIWQRGLCSKGYSICHGVSGNAYAFLELYQTTKSPVYLYRACYFMEWCMAERPGTEMHRPDRPASLFEGLLGRLYLAEDILQPLNAKFPAMCL